MWMCSLDAPDHKPRRARECSNARAYLKSGGDGGGPRRPYFLLCQIGDQQSEQEDRGEKSDLEQKTFNAVRFKRNSASKQGSPPTSLPQGQALARVNSNTNRASFTSCLDCGAKAHKETSALRLYRLAHQHTRAPEVQTTGDTTPDQQIVYAVSLATSGGGNAKSGTERRKKGCGCGFSAVSVTGPVTPLSAFHFSICSCNDLSDFSTSWFLSMPSMLSEKETHCVSAAAIVQGVLQQATAINTTLGRIYPHPYRWTPQPASGLTMPHRI